MYIGVCRCKRRMILIAPTSRVDLLTFVARVAIYAIRATGLRRRAHIPTPIAWNDVWLDICDKIKGRPLAISISLVHPEQRWGRRRDVLLRIPIRRASKVLSELLLETRES